MRYLLTIFILTFLTTEAFSRGGSGIYYVKGIAYGTSNGVLKNTELIIKIGKEIKTIKTDENGQYEIEVRWASACPSGISHTRWERECQRLNPKHIYVEYKDKKIKLDNDWKKYAQLFPETKEEVTRKEDLHFTV